jgi:hypothetical protein
MLAARFKIIVDLDDSQPKIRRGQRHMRTCQKVCITEEVTEQQTA